MSLQPARKLSLSAHTKAVGSIRSEKSKTHSAFLASGRNMDLSDQLFAGLSLPGKQTAVPKTS